MVGLLALLAAATVLGAATASAADLPSPSFELPVACAMDKVCSIQKYFDHDPSAARMDYACGRLSLDGDTGTDFRVPDYVTMDRGVAVVAAAPGVVKATRDGMADVSVREIGHDALAGKDAGNGVVIDHGNGWETQYSHLKNGSIAVTPGERVTTGQTLGLIGLSGNTEYPHVEFTVRRDGKAVDPFVGLAPFKACGDARRPLWSKAALAQLPYHASGLLIAGFASGKPSPEPARRGAYSATELAADVPALVLWVDVFGVMKGDRQRFRIDGPDGRSIHDSETAIDANNISWFAFSGRKRPDGGWAPGTYRGTYTLSRAGQPVVTATAEVTLVAH